MVRFPLRQAASERSDQASDLAEDCVEEPAYQRQRHGRWHDNRHTLITDLAERGAGDQTIMDIAGHVSKQMLKHYSHIRMEAKRAALESIVDRPLKQESGAQVGSPVRADAQQIEGESLQKPLQSAEIGGQRCKRKVAKRLKRIGSSGRIRIRAGC